MTFFLIIIFLAALSVLWAYISLKQEMKKTEVEKQVKKDLSKGRVIFYSSVEDSVS